MKNVLIGIMATLGVAGWIEAFCNYRKYEDKRAEATEKDWKLREYVSFIHHTRGGERESLLPSQQRTLDRADNDYIEIYGDSF